MIKKSSEPAKNNLSVETAKDNKHSEKRIYILLVIASIFFFSLFVVNRITTKKNTSKPSINKVENELVNTFPELPVPTNATIVESYEKKEGERQGFYAKWTLHNTSVVESAEWFYDQISTTQGIVIKNLPEEYEGRELAFVLSNNNKTAHVYFEVEDETTYMIVEYPLE